MENKINMDSRNTQQIGQNTITQPVQIPEKPKVNYWMITAIVFFCLFIGSLGWYLFSRSKRIDNNSFPPQTTQQQVTNTPTSVISPTTQSQQKNSEILSFDDKTNKYVNYIYGFSIKYPKYNQSSSTCEEWRSSISGVMPLKIFEESTNTFYISEEKLIEWQDKQVSGGGYQSDPSTCKVVENNLNLIKDGYDSGIQNPLANKRYPNKLQFNYRRINTDADLVNLAQSIYNGCYIGEKQPLKNTTDVYQVKLVDKSGVNNNPEGGCFTNFVYLFFYSPKNQVAVITSGFQNLPFNGTNGQSEPIVEFFTN